LRKAVFFPFGMALKKAIDKRMTDEAEVVSLVMRYGKIVGTTEEEAKYLLNKTPMQVLHEDVDNS